MSEQSRLHKAFNEPTNLIGMAALASLSAATLSPLPFLAGLIAETAYLLFVPDSQWYRDKQTARQIAEVERRRNALKEVVLPTLRPEMQIRYAKLEQIRAEIASQTVEGESWFRDLVGKLDYLLEKFLTFARNEVQFRNHLLSVQQEVRGTQLPPTSPTFTVEMPDRRTNRRENSKKDERPISEVDRAPADLSSKWVEDAIRQVSAHYTEEVAELKASIESEQDPNTRAVLEKRADVLNRRQEFASKIGKILTNLNHQLELLEDSFGLINDQIRARSPEQILADVDEMVWQTDTMTQVLEDIAPYEQLVARLG